MSNGIHYFTSSASPSVDYISAVYPDGAPETLTAAAPACSLAKFVSNLDATSNNVAATLADGLVHGQRKRVRATVIGGNTVTLTLASAVSTSLDVVTFTVIGDQVDLIWNEEDGYWRIIDLESEAGASATPTVA